MKPCINPVITLALLIGLHQAIAQINFAPATTNAVGVNPASVAVVDVNGDGKLDLICANTGDNTLTVLTNNGSSVFGSNATYTVGAYPVSVVAADINGDGKVDLICANFNDRTISVLTNNGNGVFSSNATYTVAASPASVVSVTAADINGDGKLDLVCVNRALVGTLLILTNNGAGIFSSNATYAVGGSPATVAAVDINGDGKLDLICLNLDAISFFGSTLSVLTNNGSGIFGSNATYTATSGPGTASSFVAADVNGDGKPDLICAQPHLSSTLLILTNNGGGIFSSNTTLSVGSSLNSVMTADVNGDGKIDLIYLNSNTNTLSVLINNGSGVFTFAATNTVTGIPNSVIAADLNGDGKLDLICSSPNSNTLSVLINTTTFPPPTSTPSLNIKPSVSGMFLSWPSASAGWSLQQNPDLTTTNWSPSGYSGYSITDDGTNKSLIVTPPIGSFFFRLLHP